MKKHAQKTTPFAAMNQEEIAELGGYVTALNDAFLRHCERADGVAEKEQKDGLDAKQGVHDATSYNLASVYLDFVQEVSLEQPKIRQFLERMQEKYKPRFADHLPWTQRTQKTLLDKRELNKIYGLLQEVASAHYEPLIAKAQTSLDELGLALTAEGRADKPGSMSDSMRLKLAVGFPVVDITRAFSRLVVNITPMQKAMEAAKAQGNSPA